MVAESQCYLDMALLVSGALWHSCDTGVVSPSLGLAVWGETSCSQCEKHILSGMLL